jgi:hypothetical protein
MLKRLDREANKTVQLDKFAKRRLHRARPARVGPEGMLRAGEESNATQGLSKARQQQQVRWCLRVISCLD